MKRLTAIVLVMAALGIAGLAADPPASQPSKIAADRAEKLKADVKTFTLSLDYNGQQDKPYYHLRLSVPPLPGNDRANPFYQSAQIAEDEAKTIIDHLAVEGFLDKALDGNRNASPLPPKGPYYALTVRVENKGDPVLYEEWLGWNLKMLQRFDGLRKLLKGDAAKGMDLLLGRMAGHRKEWAQQATTKPAVSTPDIAKLIADLSSDDGQVRITATKAIFALGKDALEPLKKAGATQISPFGTISTRRIDIVYSLLEGLKPNPVPARAGYTANGFGLHAAKGCTQDDVAKMGEKHGFTISGTFAPAATPSCYVKLNPGKNLADVLRAVLSEEPQVISVNLNYFET